ncbi:MAG: hypothetical protein CMA63_06810 [Euryarchaeota archaeon]|nr:hypothetical protein [Euryarchaeota archaeon]
MPATKPKKTMIESINARTSLAYLMSALRDAKASGGVKAARKSDGWNKKDVYTYATKVAKIRSSGFEGPISVKNHQELFEAAIIGDSTVEHDEEVAHTEEGYASFDNDGDLVIETAQGGEIVDVRTVNTREVLEAMEAPNTEDEAEPEVSVEDDSDVTVVKFDMVVESADSEQSQEADEKQKKRAEAIAKSAVVADLLADKPTKKKTKSQPRPNTIARFDQFMAAAVETDDGTLVIECSTLGFDAPKSWTKHRAIWYSSGQAGKMLIERGFNVKVKKDSETKFLTILLSKTQPVSEPAIESTETAASA